MKRTQIYLTNPENESIKEIIKKNSGGTKAEIIRRALDEYIEKYNKILWVKPLPNPLHIGRKIKVIKGQWAGKIGTVIEHWINADDCSGGYGNHLYQLDTHNYGCQNNSFGINSKDCEFLD